MNDKPTLEEIQAAELAAKQKAEAAALAKMKPLFDVPRWAKIEAQAVKIDAELPALCRRLLDTSSARYPDNALAAQYSASIRLLISVNSVPGKADIERFEAALKSGTQQAPVDEAKVMEAGLQPAANPVPASAPVKKGRGGKADAAPPAAS